jgi:dihydrofolate reductase
MARLVINNAMTVNGAFEAPSPDEWLVLDPDSNNVSLEQFLVADAMVLGRKTYEGLAAVWPQLVDDPTLGPFAHRLNSMPKYVASQTLHEPLSWNATLLEGDLAASVRALKDRHDGTLIVSGAGELAHELTTQGLVDEFWFWVGPYLWQTGPRIFRWCRAGSPGIDRVDDVPFGRAAAGLSASTQPVEPADRHAHGRLRLVSSTALRISRVTVSGCDTMDACEAATSSIRAFPRPAMNR